MRRPGAVGLADRQREQLPSRARSRRVNGPDDDVARRPRAQGAGQSVGSTNWDPRSFRLNDETNLNVYDADFARQQVEVFRRDLTQSRRITLAEWRARPWREKVVEQLASFLGSLL